MVHNWACDVVAKELLELNPLVLYTVRAELQLEAYPVCILNAWARCKMAG